MIEMTYDEVRKKIFHRLVKQNKLLRRKTRSIESILEHIKETFEIILNYYFAPKIKKMI